MDNLTKEQRRNNMIAIRSSNTKIENLVCKALWAKGIRFRKNVKDLPGKPDIAIKKYKIAIFLDSCFWHKCPFHFKDPKSNIEYWGPKIEANVKRDNKINRHYQENGWNLLRIWEHEIKNNFNVSINSIFEFIERQKRKVY